MRRSIVAVCASLPMLMGADSFTVENADLVHVSGPAEMNVTNGSEIYRYEQEGEGWQALFSRSAGASSIEIEAEPGTYSLKIWSIAADPMHPQRELSTDSVTVGEAGNTETLLALLGAWGPCSSGSCTNFDYNGDGSVNVTDLLELLGNGNW